MVQFKKIYGLSVFALSSAVSGAAFAGFTPTPTSSGNNFSNVVGNITSSIEEIPGLIASVSYMLGLLLGVLGIIKVKDHVDNPTQTPMKDGAVRIVAGGALFALPMLMEAMQNTIGTTNAIVGPASLEDANPFN